MAGISAHLRQRRLRRGTPTTPTCRAPGPLFTSSVPPTFAARSQHPARPKWPTATGASGRTRDRRPAPRAPAPPRRNRRARLTRCAPACFSALVSASCAMRKSWSSSAGCSGHRSPSTSQLGVRDAAVRELARQRLQGGDEVAVLERLRSERPHGARASPMLRSTCASARSRCARATCRVLEGLLHRLQGVTDSGQVLLQRIVQLAGQAGPLLERGLPVSRWRSTAVCLRTSRRRAPTQASAPPATATRRPRQRRAPGRPPRRALHEHDVPAERSRTWRHAGGPAAHLDADPGDAHAAARSQPLKLRPAGARQRRREDVQRATGARAATPPASPDDR